MGSTLNLHSSAVVIVLTHADSTTLEFTWDSHIAEYLSPADLTTVADYIETHDGKLGWNPRRRQEKLWWLIGLGQSLEDVVEYRTKADLADCDRNHPCTCFSFEAFEISSEGYLVEIAKSVCS